MTVFDIKDYKRKASLDLYLHCGPFEKSKWKVQNVKNTIAKTDTKCYENLR